MTDEQFKITFGWSGSCSACLQALPTLPEISFQYFEVGCVQCSKCGAEIDPWQTAVDGARKADLGFFLPISIGAKFTAFSFSLRSNETKMIDFTEYGVPSSAVILSVFYTPHGACSPVELHGNNARRRAVGTKVTVFGRPLNASVGEDKVSALVVWTDQWGEPDAWLMLAHALEEAAASRFIRAIVPAHSAFEISLSRFLKEQFEAFAAKDAVKTFMVNNISASAALNVVLSYVCGVRKVSRLPDPLRSRLNRLRNLRNNIVHDGLKEVDSTEARELLCAAVFGFEYLRFLREKIKGETTT